MKNKVLLIIWFILLIGIFTLLSIIGFKHKDDVASYREYEDVLVNAAREYTIHNKTYPKKGSRLSIKIDDLIKDGFVNKKDIVKGCTGNIIVKYDKVIDYIPNLKCKYYKSNNK